MSKSLNISPENNPCLSWSTLYIAKEVYRLEVCSFSVELFGLPRFLFNFAGSLDEETRLCLWVCTLHELKLKPCAAVP